MMRTYLFIGIFFFGSMLSYAQNKKHINDNFKSGYIITNESDTIFGLIDYRTDLMNSISCTFKANENGQRTVYFPGDIFGYRFSEEGKFYVTKSITIESEIKVVFLEFLVNGIVNLYYYPCTTDANSFREMSLLDYYLIEDEFGQMTPITKKPDEYVDVEQIPHKKRDFAYKGIIKYLFQDSETVMKDVDKLPFNTQSMINITKQYHDDVCTSGEPCIMYVGKMDKKPRIFRFSAYGGMIMPMGAPDLIFSTTSGLAPAIGAQMNIFTPRFSKAFSFQLDLSLFSLYPNDSEPGEPRLYGLSIRAGGKYRFGQGLLRPTIEGGLNCWHIYSGMHAAVGVDIMTREKQSIFLRAGIESIGVITFIPGMYIASFNLGYNF